MSEGSSRREFLISGMAAGASMLMPPQAQAEKSFTGAGSEWRFYGGDQGASRYSPLDQINLFNVHRLKPAWIHHTGDKLDRPKTMIQCTPIVIGDAMYLTTARLQVRALNAATGEVLWNFDPYAGQRSSRARGVNRGVTYFEDGRDKRIFAAIQEKLFCLDARTGELIKSFGENGVVDLKQDFDRDMEGLFYKCTSPPVIYEDLILVSGGGGEGPRREGPGHIRGYDVYTGKRRWIFHTIPFPGEFGYETWSPDSWDVNGGTNNWAGMSLDTERGWLFASIGSPSFDFWGGDRIGDNLFGNCVLALDAKTGKRVWHYQIVRHDVWDYDLAAQPALVRLRKGGRLVDAVVQTTKMGLLFVLDRETGEPLFPIEERPVPESDLPDEKLAASQPVPLKPASLCRREFTEDLVTDISPEAHQYVLKKFRAARTGGLYTPPTKQGTVIYPGFSGGVLWGGISFDPDRNWMYVNSNETTNLCTVVDGKPEDKFRFTHAGYIQLLDPEGYPAIKPPWGKMNCIDLDSGEYVWREVLGEHAELTARGIQKTGTLSFGGSVATKGGLVFIGATADPKFRAFDAKSGAEVWEWELQAGCNASPCCYEVGGKQFVAVAAGGGRPKLGIPAGDEIAAFSLG
ncbi:MAG: pyrroloquinoline quinone-dependent dehydrogenase [Bryobacterales bacterium]|nr:pyrroloquinoline quinone-dependent dehydrogenase [Bryobacterales bacterium]MDE0293857.1 pyrroloquinoline quinone-dependent dehydrogenase [Bryobacterales bacterium]